MNKNNTLHNSFIPSENEIHQILDRTLKESPSNYPTVVLKIELARLMGKFIGRLEGEIEDSVRRMGDSIEKK
jgi:hypothetical protein